MDELRDFYTAVESAEVPASLHRFQPETVLIKSVLPGLSGLGLGVLAACILYGVTSTSPAPAVSASITPYLAQWVPEDAR